MCDRLRQGQVNEGDFNVRELHLEPKNTRSSAVFRLSNGRLNDLQDVRVGLFEGAAAERAVADALVRAGCVDDERCRVPRCLGRAVVRFPLGELECRSNRVVGLMLEARIMMVVMIMSAPLCLWCDGDENDRDSALLASHLSTLTIANVTLTQLAIGGHWLSLDSLTIANATVDELLLRMSAPLLSQFEWSNVTGTRLPLREIPPQVQLVEIHGATEMLADGILVLPLVRAVRLSVGGTGASSLDLTHCMQLTHLQIANEPHLSSVALSPRVRLAGLALSNV
jgi:hypothetical protein